MPSASAPNSPPRADAPDMGAIYKMVELDIGGIKRFTAKFSEDKPTLPGAKQVFRFPDRDILGTFRTAARRPKPSCARSSSKGNSSPRPPASQVPRVRRQFH